jgi:hypothetical protein
MRQDSTTTLVNLALETAWEVLHPTRIPFEITGGRKGGWPPSAWAGDVEVKR